MKFHAWSAGNFPPAAIIYGPATGLAVAASMIAVNHQGHIYVARGLGKDAAVLRFPPGADTFR